MQIYNFLFAKSSHLKNRQALFWLFLSVGFSLFYSYLAWQKAIAGEYVIQDDARQHIFWMLRFNERDLFPNDLIANYFQSVAPNGYKFLYWLVNKLGIEPILFSKILPSILGIILTIYSFVLALEFLPLPLTGFVFSLLLNQNLWLQDGLISGTPKAFAPPLSIAFIYYFLRRSNFGVSIVIILFGLFYPSLVFICCGLLVISLFSFTSGRIEITTLRKDYLFTFTGLIVAFFVLLPYAIATSEYSPIITVSQAKQLPEFMSGGRTGFFNDNAWDFWFNGSRSSLRIPSALMPPLAYLTLLFPLIRYRNRLPLNKINWLRTTPQITLLPRLIIVSVVMFFIAHSFLFSFHLPSRYTQHTFRIIIILTASIIFTFTLEFLLKKNISRTPLKKITYAFFALLLATTLIFYPQTIKRFVWTRYIVGNEPTLYQFFQQQPLDTVIASLTAETDNLPTFTRRSILVSREYAIPYHYGYYQPFRQKATDLIEAQYSPDPTVVKNFITKYNISHWLIENSSFVPEYIADNKWIRQHQPTAQKAIDNLHQNRQPIIALVRDRCSVYTSDRYKVIASECILKQNTGILERGQSRKSKSK